MKLGCIPRDNKVGILLAQLGTPDAPTPASLKVYLKQFLSDKRVVEGGILWWFILNFIVLVVRPRKSAALYAKIWTKEGSPLLVYTKKQTEALKLAMPKHVEVTFGMRYGNPSLKQGIKELIERGCRRILIVPLYPQYSAATTGSTYDAVFSALLEERWVPTIKVVEPYYNHPAYLKALSDTINLSLKNLTYTPDRLILSFHGIPWRYVKKGDPYCCHCTETVKSLIPLLNFPSESVIQTFQSRFGREQWLVPYTDETLEELPSKGVKKVAVACPGFVSDCLETIDEIGREAKESFEEAGGEDLFAIPCLNDHPSWLEALKVICDEEISNWLKVESSCPNGDMVSCPVKAHLKI